MRGVYEASANVGAVTAAQTLLYLTAPSGKCVEIISAHVTNESNETNEQMEITLQRITTLGTPTATANTPTPTELGDAAAGSTVATDVTASEPTYTAGKDFGRAGVPSLAGWRFEPEPEARPIVANAASIGIQILTAITSADLVVRLVFREIG